MNIGYNIVSIEGNIGSGKSTLLSNLKETLQNRTDIVFLKEPVDEWEKITDENGITMLEKFYSNQKDYSFPFQMMAYISRLALLKEAVKNNPGAIIITERSLYTDKMVFAKMLYESKNIEMINYKIYLKWFETFASEFPVNKVIYVKSSPETCFNRIEKRSRTGESSISLDYLTNCDKYHNEMLNKEVDSCVCENQLVIDGNIDIHENNSQLKDWINNIITFVDSL
jgi:deoxyadenosine/deoxycytidine kinase